MKTLVIAEKPSVGRDIARVLKCEKKNNSYIEGTQYIVTWGMGHLVTLQDPEGYDKKYKEWKMEDIPIMPKRMEIEVIRQTGRQYQAVKNLIHRNDVKDLVDRYGCWERRRAGCPVDSEKSGEQEALQKTLDFFRDG